MNEYLNDDLLKQIATNLNIKLEQVKTVLTMLDEGSTVPFIARYRKEMTGALDEEQIRAISKEWEYGEALLKRKEDVIRLIEEKGLMTDELKNKIMSSNKLVEVEDLYRPFKEKKKTKATEAIRLGLEPLAKIMMSFKAHGDRLQIASGYITEEVKDSEAAITQAKYIIAEWISDNAAYRKGLRSFLNTKGTLETKIKKDAVDEKKVYENYYDYKETLRTVKPHRILAINRAEDEKVINVSIVSDINNDLAYLYKHIIRDENNIFANDIKDAINDAYKRLIMPSIEREVRAELSEKAENGAIEVFSMNLKNLLLQAPIKGKVVLGVDPAFRTGCKLAVVSATGKVLEIGVIYPNELSKGATIDERQLAISKKKVLELILKYRVEIIAIGNGTASRETESFISNIIKDNKLTCQYVIVSEAGASVYSASDLAREEFPDFEVQERSAVSIARRLQDPLSELVKIEPKAIGVGQYQHDVTQSKLTESLDFVVSEAVNKVGVNVNTASVSLLTYVSGLNKSVANNVIKYRDEIGSFKNRNELKKVPKLGAKTYEQAIGFLRITDGENPLDMTSIHPESYKVAEKIVKELKIDVTKLGTKETIDLVSNIDKLALRNKYEIDAYTLDDILDSFKAPLRDPRDQYDTPKLRSDVLHLEDLKIGDELEGTVRNVVDFGAFVDCGLKNDGLVHISKMTTKYIKHPSEMVSVGDLVKVYVLSIDLSKQKLALTMVKPQ